MVSLRLVASLKASKNVIQDIDLTWHQMAIAKTILIQQITKFHWSDNAITSLAEFFMNLEVHQYHQWAYGEQALLIYQACMCCEWHDRLKQDNGFNIATINENLLQNILREVMDKTQADSLNEVSFSSLSKFWTLLIVTPSNLPLFTWILFPSSRTMHHAPCTTHHTSCAMHLLSCNTHHAPWLCWS